MPSARFWINIAVVTACLSLLFVFQYLGAGIVPMSIALIIPVLMSIVGLYHIVRTIKSPESFFYTSFVMFAVAWLLHDAFHAGDLPLLFGQLRILGMINSVIIFGAILLYAKENRFQIITAVLVLVMMLPIILIPQAGEHSPIFAFWLISSAIALFLYSLKQKDTELRLMALYLCLPYAVMLVNL